MSDNSYRALIVSDGFSYLFIFCGGVWLFAADDLMIATLIADIVREIGGANLIGWAGALFQAAAIVSGALGAFLLRRWGMRAAFTGAGLVFIAGCLVSALAPNMPTFQVGRFLQALAGSGLTTLTFIGVPNLFGRTLQTRAMSLVSIVWGIAAFSGPLVGGLFAEFATWRWAFIFAAVIALLITATAFVMFGRHPQFSAPAVLGSTEKFPLVRMALLFCGVMLIATAGVAPSPILSPLLIVAGAVLVGMFFLRDRQLGETRLLPYATLDPRTRVGAGVGMFVFLSAAVVGVYIFAPVLVAFLFGLSPILIGYMVFGEALGWSLAAVAVSGTPPEREGRVIVLGAVLIGVAILLFNAAFHAEMVWFAWAGFAVQGIGFGLLWSLTLRRAADHPDRLEVDRIAGALPTMHRLGLGVSAALLGLAANSVGFSDAMSAETARTVAIWLSGLAVPMVLIGIGMALQFGRETSASDSDTVSA